MDFKVLSDLLAEMSFFSDLERFLNSQSLKCETKPRKTLKGYVIKPINLKLADELDGFLGRIEECRVECEVGRRGEWVYEVLIFRDDVHGLISLEEVR